MRHATPPHPADGPQPAACAQALTAPLPLTTAASNRPFLPAASTRRACRVNTLIIATVLMSLGDLYITLLYLQSVGMGEANPIARYIIGHGSSLLLILWKCATITLAALILYTARRTRSGEIGAWICCCILVWLTARWLAYASEATHLTPVLHAMADHDHARWVSIPTEPALD